MLIIPAIDLKDAKAVRLEKGLMESAKIYSNNPCDLAKKFEDLGAKWLHVVDLDGAFAGDSINYKTIEEIKKSTNLKIEVGGGIRNENKIKEYLNLGISRVILGSIALKNIEFAKQMASLYPVVIGIDAKDGFVATQGWGESSLVDAVKFASEFKNSQVEAIICTDISKDGMLCGVNVKFSQDIASASGIFTIASGGVSNLDDILGLCGKGIGGVIVGKAYYEGKVDLKQAFLEVEKL